MEFSQNNNIFEYSNHKSIRKLKKQLGGVAKKISNPDNDDILKMKIYLKIYIRLFLYIQYKLNKKFMTGDGINNPNRAINQRTLVDAMNLYRQDVEMQTYLQSTDLFFIRPLFESMCRDNYNDICIQYFNSFILPKKEFDPEGVKQLMEKIIGKYFNLMKDYEHLADKKAYQDILNYVRDLDGQLSEDDFVKLMDMIKREIQKFKGIKGTTPPSDTSDTRDTKERGRGREEREREPSEDNQQLIAEIDALKIRIQKLESFKDKTDEDIKKLSDPSKKDAILKELTGKLTTLNSQSADKLRKEIEQLRSDTDKQIAELKSLIKKSEDALKVIRTEFDKKIDDLKKRDSSKTKEEIDSELAKLRTEYEARIKQLEKEILELRTKIDEKKSEPIDPSVLNSFKQEFNLFKQEPVSPGEEPLKAEILSGLRQLLEEIQKTNKSIAELLAKKLDVSVEGMGEVLEFIKEFHSKLDVEREARITAEIERGRTETAGERRLREQIQEERARERTSTAEERGRERTSIAEERGREREDKERQLADKDRTIASLLSRPGITIEQIQAVIKAQTDELKGLVTTVRPPESSTQNFDAQFTRLETKLRDVEREVRTTSERTQDKADANKRELQQDIANIHSTLTQQHSLLINGLLDELRRKSADQSSNDKLIEEFKALRDHLKDYIVRNESQFGSLQGQLDDISGEVAGLSSQIEDVLIDLNARISTINTSIGQLRSSNEQNFRELHNQLFQEFGSLHQALETQLHTHMEQLYKYIYQNQEELLGTIAENNQQLLEEINTLKRRIETILPELLRQIGAQLQPLELTVQQLSEGIDDKFKVLAEQLDVKFKAGLETSKKEILAQQVALQEVTIEELRREFAGMFQGLSEQVRDNIQQLANLTDFKRDQLNLQKLAMESMREANNNLLTAMLKSSDKLESVAKAGYDFKTAQQESSLAKAELDALKEKSRNNESELQRLRDQLSQANTEKERDKRELIQAQLEEAKRREDKLLDKISTQQTVVTDAGRRETDTGETTRRLFEEQRRLTENMERSNAKLVEAKEEQVRREREHTRDLEEARRIAVRESQDQLSRQLDEEKRKYDSEKRDKDRLQTELTAELRKAAELAQAKSQKDVQIQTTSLQPDSEKLLAQLEKDKQELKREIERTHETVKLKSAEIDGKVTGLERLQDIQTKMIESLRSQSPAPIPPAPAPPPAPAQGPPVIINNNNNISPAGAAQPIQPQFIPGAPGPAPMEPGGLPGSYGAPGNTHTSRDTKTFRKAISATTEKVKAEKDQIKAETKQDVKDRERERGEKDYVLDKKIEADRKLEINEKEREKALRELAAFELFIKKLERTYQNYHGNPDKTILTTLKSRLEINQQNLLKINQEDKVKYEPLIPRALIVLDKIENALRVHWRIKLEQFFSEKAPIDLNKARNFGILVPIQGLQLDTEFGIANRETRALLIRFIKLASGLDDSETFNKTFSTKLGSAGIHSQTNPEKIIQYFLGKMSKDFFKELKERIRTAGQDAAMHIDRELADFFRREIEQLRKDIKLTQTQIESLKQMKEKDTGLSEGLQELEVKLTTLKQFIHTIDTISKENYIRNDYGEKVQRKILATMISSVLALLNEFSEGRDNIMYNVAQVKLQNYPDSGRIHTYEEFFGIQTRVESAVIDTNKFPPVDADTVDPLNLYRYTSQNNFLVEVAIKLVEAIDVAKRERRRERNSKIIKSGKQLFTDATGKAFGYLGLPFYRAGVIAPTTITNLLHPAEQREQQKQEKIKKGEITSAKAIFKPGSNIIDAMRFNAQKLAISLEAYSELAESDEGYPSMARLKPRQIWRHIWTLYDNALHAFLRLVDEELQLEMYFHRFGPAINDLLNLESNKYLKESLINEITDEGNFNEDGLPLADNKFYTTSPEGGITPQYDFDLLKYEIPRIHTKYFVKDNEQQIYTDFFSNLQRFIYLTPKGTSWPIYFIKHAYKKLSLESLDPILLPIAVDALEEEKFVEDDPKKIASLIDLKDVTYISLTSEMETANQHLKYQTGGGKERIPIKIVQGSKVQETQIEDEINAQQENLIEKLLDFDSIAGEPRRITKEIVNKKKSEIENEFNKLFNEMIDKYRRAIKRVGESKQTPTFKDEEMRGKISEIKARSAQLLNTYKVIIERLIRLAKKQDEEEDIDDERKGIIEEEKFKDRIGFFDSPILRNRIANSGTAATRGIGNTVFDFKERMGDAFNSGKRSAALGVAKTRLGATKLIDARSDRKERELRMNTYLSSLDNEEKSLKYKLKDLDRNSPDYEAQKLLIMSQLQDSKEEKKFLKNKHKLELIIEQHDKNGDKTKARTRVEELDKLVVEELVRLEDKLKSDDRTLDTSITSEKLKPSEITVAPSDLEQEYKLPDGDKIFLITGKYLKELGLSPMKNPFSGLLQIKDNSLYLINNNEDFIYLKELKITRMTKSDKTEIIGSLTKQVKEEGEGKANLIAAQGTGNNTLVFSYKDPTNYTRMQFTKDKPVEILTDLDIEKFKTFSVEITICNTDFKPSINAEGTFKKYSGDDIDFIITDDEFVRCCDSPPPPSPSPSKIESQSETIKTSRRQEIQKKMEDYKSDQSGLFGKFFTSSDGSDTRSYELKKSIEQKMQDLRSSSPSSSKDPLTLPAPSLPTPSLPLSNVSDDDLSSVRSSDDDLSDDTDDSDLSEGTSSPTRSRSSSKRRIGVPSFSRPKLSNPFRSEHSDSEVDYSEKYNNLKQKSYEHIRSNLMLVTQGLSSYKSQMKEYKKRFDKLQNTPFLLFYLYEFFFKQVREFESKSYTPSLIVLKQPEPPREPEQPERYPPPPPPPAEPPAAEPPKQPERKTLTDRERPVVSLSTPAAAPEAARQPDRKRQKEPERPPPPPRPESRPPTKPIQLATGNWLNKNIKSGHNPNSLYLINNNGDFIYLKNLTITGITRSDKGKIIDSLSKEVKEEGHGKANLIPGQGTGSSKVVFSYKDPTNYTRKTFTKEPVEILRYSEPNVEDVDFPKLISQLKDKTFSVEISICNTDFKPSINAEGSFKTYSGDQIDILYLPKEITVINVMPLKKEIVQIPGVTTTPEPISKPTPKPQEQAKPIELATGNQLNEKYGGNTYDPNSLYLINNNGDFIYLKNLTITGITRKDKDKIIASLSKDVKEEGDGKANLIPGQGTGSSKLVFSYKDPTNYTRKTFTKEPVKIFTDLDIEKFKTFSVEISICNTDFKPSINAEGTFKTYSGDDIAIL